MGKVALDSETEKALRRQFDEALACALGDPARAAIAKIALQAIIEGREVIVPTAPVAGEKDHADAKKLDLAEERRVWFKTWYSTLGFKIEVPKPNISNREFERRAKAGQALFYRPATMSVSYENFMEAVGLGEHWTLVSEADCAKVGWEHVAEGYWFWAEVEVECPRHNETWINLTASVKLLSLEEYAIVWHAHKALTGQKLDVRTYTWLRTRYGQSALSANLYGGVVYVSWHNATDLSVSYEHRGGRAAEVVKIAA